MESRQGSGQMQLDLGPWRTFREHGGFMIIIALPLMPSQFFLAGRFMGCMGYSTKASTEYQLNPRRAYLFVGSTHVDNRVRGTNSDFRKAALIAAGARIFEKARLI